MKIKNDLVTQNYTEIEYEDRFKFNAPHHFEIKNIGNGEVVTKIDMQEGPIKENGVNGCANEDLIAIVLTRLESFQNSEYKCRDNAVAITKLEEALMWLRRRTNKRQDAGIEGTSIVG